MQRAGMQVASNKKKKHPGPRNGLVPTPCAVYFEPPAWLSMLDRCRSNQISRSKPILCCWLKNLQNIGVLIPVYSSNAVQVDKHMRSLGEYLRKHMCCS